MKILFPAVLVIAALIGVSWFVSRDDSSGARATLDAIEPDPDGTVAPISSSADLADPMLDPIVVEQVASVPNGGVTPATRVASKQIFGRVVGATASDPSSLERDASDSAPAIGDKLDLDPKTAGHGLAQFTVTLTKGEKTLSTVVTNADGVFAFSLANAAGLSITVSDRANWHVIDAPRALTPEQESGDAEVIFHARSLHSAALVGIVVDENTREVLPRYLLRIEDEAGHSVREVTDDQGRFKTSIALAGGVVRIVPMDHERRGKPLEMRTLEHDALATEPKLHEVRVVSGPTFRLAVQPASGPDQTKLSARLRWPTEDGAKRADYEPVRASEPYAKSGEAPWVRLAALDPSIASTEALEVRSSDGLWRGEATVSAVRGIVPTPVDVRLEMFACVDGVVADESGKPIAGANVYLRVVSTKGKTTPRNVKTDLQGHYRFEFSPPGEATIEVKAIANAGSQRQQTLVGGEVLHVDFALPALPVVGSIRGIITSDSGTYTDDEVRVTLVPVGNPGPRWRTKPHFELQRGKRVGTFSFEGLPAGTFDVEIEEHDWFQWDNRKVSLSAPSEAVEFHVHDRALVADFVFRVSDSDNGIPIQGFHVFTKGYDNAGASVLNSNDVLLSSYPVDARFSWRLDKTGYPPQFGSIASFTRVEISGDRTRRIVELNLRPGWGDRIEVVTKYGNKPIKDATVVVDGVDFARTDSNGIANIATRDKPKSVTISLAGWEQAESYDLSSPSRRRWRWPNTVRMQKLPKKK